MSQLLFEEETFAIRGAVFEVYREMGSGFLEQVYQECLENEFSSRGILFVSQPELLLSYKGEPLKQTYRPDFICYEQIVLELKAVKSIAPEHRAQVLNYLKATNLRLGLLINYGSHPKAQIERFII
ncbi:MAG: GxxExxY protein [Chlorobi bacterium]|nr:GxxExxY protein [Chlorobiota bacterium]